MVWAQVVPGRARLFLAFQFVGEESVELLGLLLSALQLAACPGFYATATPDYYLLAVWLFFWTSVVGVAIAGHSMLESRHFLVTHAGRHLLHLSHEQLKEVGQTRREVFESLLYLLSGLAFSAGSIFYLPAVSEQDSINDLTSGRAPMARARVGEG